MLYDRQLRSLGNKQGSIYPLTPPTFGWGLFQMALSASYPCWAGRVPLVPYTEERAGAKRISGNSQEVSNRPSKHWDWKFSSTTLKFSLRISHQIYTSHLVHFDNLHVSLRIIPFHQVLQIGTIVFVCLFVCFWLFLATGHVGSYPQPGIELVPPAIEVQSLNHCTGREVP